MLQFEGTVEVEVTRRLRPPGGGAITGYKRTFLMDSASGGGATSDITKRRSARFGAERAKRGLRSFDDITCTREVQRDRQGVGTGETDSHGDMRWLMNGVGTARCTVTITKYDEDEIAMPDPLVFTGVLSGVTPPDWDANSSDNAEWSLTVSLNENVA